MQKRCLSSLQDKAIELLAAEWDAQAIEPILAASLCFHHFSYAAHHALEALTRAGIIKNQYDIPKNATDSWLAWLNTRPDLNHKTWMTMAPTMSRAMQARICELQHERFWHDNSVVRVNLAVNRYLPKNTMEFLALDDSVEVRINLARRRDLPDALVHRMSMDKDPIVRRDLAANDHV